MKKHEAIEADIASYEERIGVVVELSAEMEAEAYYDIRRILARKENILGQWKLLKELVAGRRTRLEKNLTLQKIFQDMVYMIDWMEDTQVVQTPPLGVLIRFNETWGIILKETYELNADIMQYVFIHLACFAFVFFPCSL